jgi:hypothetical protein
MEDHPHSYLATIFVLGLVLAGCGPVNAQIESAAPPLLEPSQTAPLPTALPSTFVPTATVPIPTTTAVQLEPATAAPELPPFSILLAAQGEDSERLRQVVYELKTDLPVGPAEVMLYRQKQSQTTLTAERAAAVAAKTGIIGSVDSYTGEGGDTVYTVTDGKGQVLVFSDTPLEFSYNADNVPVSGNPEKLYSFEERAQAAVDFLEAHQLLDFEYRVDPNGNPNWSDFSVAIAPSLDGHFLYENDPHDPRIFIGVDAENKVHTLIYRTLAFQPLHEVKVRPADEVWADFLAGGLNDRSYVRWVNQTGDPSKMTEAINSSTLAVVEKVELVYFAIDMRGMSARAIPQDDPARVALPVWRFACRLRDGRTFDILAEAVQP